ncbi:MAG: ComEA family DNA-binding protein [Anaerolineae bacterium]|jgi:competence protein ComEA|nr:ComEA family DNA-binding protein [Anaerolineae bacterium]
MNVEQLGLIDHPPAPEEIRRQMRAYTVRYVALVALICLIIGGLIGRLTAPEPDAGAAMELPVTQAAGALSSGNAGALQSTPELTTLRVYLSGAVMQPQVVEVPGGSLLEDALMAAGGPAPEADLESINLAAPLINHQHIHIPTRTAPSVPSASPASPVSLINLNTATLADLLTLPGIGEIRAQAILAYRAEHGPFVHVEDLQNVEGIGPTTYERLTPYITVGP